MSQSTLISPALNHTLLRLITQYKDQSILLISNDADFNQQAKQAAPQLTIRTDFTSEQTEEPAPHWFLGIVICQTDDYDTVMLDELLAKLRDIQCERVYLAHCSACSTEKDAQIRSLGFKHITPDTKDNQETEASEHLYYFDIFDYKQIPDWFNSEYWSNPDMWDKARW